MRKYLHSDWSKISAKTTNTKQTISLKTLDSYQAETPSDPTIVSFEFLAIIFIMFILIAQKIK